MLAAACLSAAGGVLGIKLLSAEGLAVGALIHGGVFFVGTHQNAVQRAVVLRVAVIGALLYGALYAFIGMTAHCGSSFSVISGIVCFLREKSILEKNGFLHWGSLLSLYVLLMKSLDFLKKTPPYLHRQHPGRPLLPQNRWQPQAVETIDTKYRPFL